MGSSSGPPVFGRCLAQGCFEKQTGSELRDEVGSTPEVGITFFCSTRGVCRTLWPWRGLSDLKIL